MKELKKMRKAMMVKIASNNEKTEKKTNLHSRFRV